MAASGLPPAPLHFECVVPILRVERLPASLDYYLKALGFRLDWQDPSQMASVSRDGKGVMLCQGAQGNPGTWVWFGVSDAGKLHDEVRARGAKIRMPLSNFPWAYEFHVEDPDGHVLRFGSDTLPGRPFDPWGRPAVS
ncbi:MAG: VOC family protein [Planctomycetes bacterium]|nr:VOC family protein [Planctomycetota bacterium]